MKKALLYLLVFYSVGAVAQVKIADQQGQTYYGKIVALCSNKIPSQSDLIAAKAGNLPASFADTLQKYDWYNLGGYYYYDKQYSNSFEQEKQNQTQYDFFRIMPDGKVANFSINRNDKEYGTIYTTAFDKNTAILYTFKKVGNYNCIEVNAFGEKSYLTILSYKDGILVYDAPQSGKAGSTESKRFREVYRAVPKDFKWDWQ